MTHICISDLTSIGSDNGLSPGRHQAIICTNAGILLIGPLGTNFSENSIEILTFSFTKMRLKVSSAKWRPFCLGLNVLMAYKWCRKLKSFPMDDKDPIILDSDNLASPDPGHQHTLHWPSLTDSYPLVKIGLIKSVAVHLNTPGLKIHFEV